MSSQWLLGVHCDERYWLLEGKLSTFWSTRIAVHISSLCEGLGLDLDIRFTVNVCVAQLHG